MMYHFMFGLRGASAAAPAAPVDSSVSAGGVALAFFSSSCISCFISQTFCSDRSAVSQGAEHEVDTASDQEIHQPEVQPEDEDRDDHHDGGRLHFFQRRRGYLLHLHANVVVEGFDLLRP